jgi:ankyrin repeat protein
LQDTTTDYNLFTPKEMTKFATRESNGYATILGELRRWVGHYIAPAVVDSDDPAPAAPAPHQALLAAAAFGGPETLELCLRATPDVNIVEPGPTQRNALHLAAAFNQYRNIVPLLRAGVNLHATTDQGFTPLFVACIVGSTEVVRVLLEEGQDNPNAKDRHGNTPLHVAAVNGRVNIARILLEHGADPFIAQDGWKPLDVALTKRCTELVEILTEAMSNPENRPDGVLRAGGR